MCTNEILRSNKTFFPHAIKTHFLVNPGLTLLLGSWLSWQDLTKFLLHLGDHGTHGKILIRSYQDTTLFQDRILSRWTKFQDCKKHYTFGTGSRDSI